MPQFRLSRAAESDIVEILGRSEESFGIDARERYRALLRAAVNDVAEDPLRPGSRERPELGDAVRSWHIRRSRVRSEGGVVRSPRHFLIYRIDDGVVVIGRVLHEAMDLPRHLAPDQVWD